MIPIVLLGVGALVGAVTTYVIQERDKTRLKEQICDLEKSHRELEEQVARATEREVRHRFERLQLLLQYSRSRLEVLMHQRDVPLDRMQRAWSTGKAITMLIQTLPADGILSAQAERFVEILVRAQAGQKLTRDEIRSLDDYLADQVPDAVREFFEDQLSSMYRQHQGRLDTLSTRRIERRAELRALKLREDVEGLHDVALKQVQADATRIEAEYAAAERALGDIKRNLVLVTRLSLPEANDEYDVLARNVLERLVQGHVLSEEDRAFLDAYRDMYFLSARETLKTRRNIDLAELKAAS